MTLDEQILLAKQEKQFKLIESAMLTGYKKNLNEEETLNFRYSKNGEMLHEFDYLGIISEIARNGVHTIEEANGLSYAIDNKIPADDILNDKMKLYAALTEARKIYENWDWDYTILSKLYAGLNEASTAKKRAALDLAYGDSKNPNDFKHAEDYIKGKEKARHLATHPKALQKLRDDKEYDPSTKPKNVPASAARGADHDKHIEKTIHNIKSTASAIMDSESRSSDKKTKD